MSAIHSSFSKASARKSAGPLTAIHPSFICGDFGEPAHGERQAAGDTCQRAGAVRVGGEAVVVEDFVGDEREFAFGAQADERVELGALHVRSGGIIGMDDDDSPRAIRDGSGDAFEVDGPRPVIGERILTDFDRIHGGKIIEQRVGRARHEHVVAGIGEQLEQVGVGFAGAGGEQDARGIHFVATRLVVGRHRFTCLLRSGGRGLVIERAGVVECAHRLRRIGETGVGGIRFREVQNGGACAPLFGEHLRQTILVKVPVEAGRKHPAQFLSSSAV